MKKIKTFIFSIFMLITISLISMNDIQAAQKINISGSSTAKPGQTITLTISISGCRGGTVVLSGQNCTISGKSTIMIDGSESVKVKVGNSGTAIIKASCNDATPTNSFDVVEAYGSKTITISSTTSSSGSSSSSNNNSSSSSSNNSNNSSSQTTQTKDTRSKDNTLSSLTVSEGTMSPSFNASKTTYDIELSGTVSEVTIDAKANDSKASVSGTGKKSLKVGNNTYSVVCTAENGSKKTYTLNFYVDEAPLVYTKYNDIDLGVIRLLDKVKAPDGFEKKTVQLEGQDIEGYTNSKLNMNIAYLVDEKGNKDFYVIEDGKVVSVYQTITVNGRVYVVLNQPTDLQEVKDLQTTTLTIDDVELSGWLFNDENLKNYSLVYLMNSEGQKHLYVYESTEGTLQIYTPSQVSNQSMNTMTYIFIGTTIFFALTTLLTMIVHMKFKKKSIASIKAYYEKRNRG